MNTLLRKSFSVRCQLSLKKLFSSRLNNSKSNAGLFPFVDNKKTFRKEQRPTSKQQILKEKDHVEFVLTTKEPSFMKGVGKKLGLDLEGIVNNLATDNMVKFLMETKKLLPFLTDKTSIEGVIYVDESSKITSSLMRGQEASSLNPFKK
jgi:hypothetical protein